MGFEINSQQLKSGIAKNISSAITLQRPPVYQSETLITF